MDRFAWSDQSYGVNEQLVAQQSGVRIYDGEEKTSFDHGNAMLTTHRLFWRDHKDPKCLISIPLALVVLAEEQAATFTKSAKISIHLTAAGGYKAPGPKACSSYDYIRLSFKEGGHREFIKQLLETLQKKNWEQKKDLPGSQPPGSRKTRAGIVDIERSLQQRHQDTDRNISQAFSDLQKLMEKAKEMVTLSKNISTKIKDKQGEITEDETIQFKSYLLSLGIPDPVTRSTHGSGNKYFLELAREVSGTMEKVLKECGGVMTLTDVYCRINRARGMELLSPDDLLTACQMMEGLMLPVRMRTFDSGVVVLQLQSHSEEAIIKSTKTQVMKEGSLTAEELAKLASLSVILAKERLFLTEKIGSICRDETAEGLRFYPNKFLETGS